MKCKEIFDRGIQFHHYCNTAYPLRPNSLAQYEVHDAQDVYEVVKKNIEAQDEPPRRQDPCRTRTGRP